MACSTKDSKIKKGTPQGVPVVYTVSHSACNISIEPSITRKQDKERFMLLELVPNNKSSFEAIGSKFFGDIDKDFYKRLLIYILLHHKEFLNNYKECFNLYKKNENTSMLTDHVIRCCSSITAGYSILRPDIELSSIVNILASTITEYNMRNTVVRIDREDGIHSFLSLLCPMNWVVDNGTPLLQALTEGFYEKFFSQMGVKYVKKTNSLYIWTKSPIIKQLYKHNEEYPIRNSLDDISCFRTYKVISTKINKRSFRCVKINLDKYFTATKS